MTERNVPRVVLLARAGDARDRLSSALQAAGAQLALVADPLSADPGEVIAARPQAVLVALEPAIEDALERFDALLTNPAVTVIFEEAELAARRAGWDAARWERHLSAKLNRHGDVLPPGWDAERDLQPSPGPLPPRDASGLDIAAFADEAQELAVEVPRDESPAAGVRLEDGLAGELRLEESDAAAGQATLETGYELADAPVAGGSFAEWTMGEAAVDGPSADGLTGDAVPTGGLDFEGIADDEPLAAVSEEDEAGIAQSFGDADAAQAGTAHRSLELVDVDALFASVETLESDAQTFAPPPPAPAPEFNLYALARRAAGLTLADVDSYGHGPLRGAVLVEGGLGGPDAVRQLLAAIPEDFPRPVLVRLQLDGGRYDRLVKQMGRAARLSVALAAAGQAAEAGTVYFVPPGLSLAQSNARLVFVDDETGSQPLLGALPAGDSAVLLMSGSGVGSVDAAMARAPAGLLVAGQSFEGCYDTTASAALIAYGGTTGTPVELAMQLAERWPS